MRILFVENHAAFAHTVIDKFLSAHSVTVTPSLAGAMELLESREFDVVLLDYDLDDGKGIDLLTSEFWKNRPPVIAISAFDDKNKSLMEAGADAVCGKLNFASIGTTLEAFKPKRDTT